jgi:hypothetical protein
MAGKKRQPSMNVHRCSRGAGLLLIANDLHLQLIAGLLSLSATRLQLTIGD